jgi:uncharacterized protein
MNFARKKFIFDTSTLISAAIRVGSVPDRAFMKAAKTGDLIVSVETLGELREVLCRPSFDRYRHPQERDEFVAMYEAMTICVADVLPVMACRDPKDDKFLALAVASGANVIVSSDGDLLVLETFHDTVIITPRQFLDSVQLVS